MTLLLTQEDVTAVIDMQEAIAAVRTGFREEGEGRVTMPPLLLARAEQNWLRILPALMPGLGYMGFKAMNKVQGVGLHYLIQLYSMETGELLALLDADPITTLRTAATTGLACSYLAREEAAVVGCLGSGQESRGQLEAICAVRPVRAAKVYSPRVSSRQAFAEAMSARLGIEVRAVASPAEAIAGTDISYAITNSTEPFIREEWFGAGMHFAAAGATRHEQKELFPRVFARADRLVVDEMENVFREAGDVIAAVEAGCTSRERATGLADLVTGRAPGRGSAAEFTLFKSVGSAVQDLSLAVAVYRRALAAGVGREIGEFPRLKRKQT